MRFCNLLGASVFLSAVGAQLGSAAAQSLAMQGTFDVVAITGQEVPSDGGSLILNGFLQPVLSAGGDSTFFATVTGAGVTSDNNHTIMTTENGAVRLVARGSQQAPGTAPGVVFDPSFATIATNNVQGQVGLTARLAGAGVTSSNDVGIFTEGGGGGLSLVAREGGQVPGFAPGVVFAGSPFGIQGLAASGDTAFIAKIAGAGIDQFNDNGLWTADASTGQLALVVREGDPAPGFGVGATFGGSVVGSSPFSATVFTPAGQWAFVGDVSTPGGDSGGVYHEVAPGDLQLRVREGDVAPDTEVASVFNRLTRLDMNAAGDVAVAADLDGPSINATNGDGVWAFDQGGAHLVARDGQAAPGLPGVTLDVSTLNRPAINASGQVAVTTDLAGASVTLGNDTAIWAEDGLGGLRLVAREGDLAPGVFGAVAFQEMSHFSFNAAGNVAFRGGLVGAGIDTTNDGGIWMETAPGSLALVIREGDLLEVAPGDFRTVQFADFFRQSTGGENGFNDSTQLSMLVNFTDGTSAILSVPEPPAMLLAGIAVCGLWGWHLRRHHSMPRAV